MKRRLPTWILCQPCDVVCVACLVFLSGCAGHGGEPSAGSVPERRGARLQTPAPPEVQPDRPPTAQTLYAMADILATQGKDPECESLLRQCIHDYPQFTRAYNRLAELQMRQGRLREATDTLSATLAISPRDPVLRNNLGMCLLVCREYDKALEHFAAAAGLVPESERYRSNMATTLGLLGRDEEALALLRQIFPEPQAKHNLQILCRARTDQAQPH